MRFIVIAVLSTFLVGCAVASDVEPIGKNTYMVTAPETLGSTGRIIALRGANKFCASQGNNVVVRQVDATVLTVSIAFSCLSENDPGYLQPNLQKNPSVIIEK